MSDNKSEYVGRVDQIDATEFDREIIYQLTNQHLGEAAARCLPPDHWFHRYFPELQLVLKSGIYATYLFRQNSTYGLDIQGLKFQDGSRSTMYKSISKVSQHLKYLAFIIISVLPGYLQDRNCLPSYPKVNFILQLLRFTNLLVFLQEGIYPTLETRMLSLEVSNIDGAQGYHISYNVLSREIMWHSFMDLTKTLAPLINWKRITGRFKHFKEKIMYGDNVTTGRIKTQVGGICGICNNAIVNASIIGLCKHSFCYYCIALQLKNVECLPCPLCGKDLTKREIKLAM